MTKAAMIQSVIFTLILSGIIRAQNYPIVDTGQTKTYNNTSEIAAPSENSAFYGQDAQFDGVQPSYTDNGDGTVTDNVTGLMWQRDLPDDKYTYAESVVYAEASTLAGYTDWRLPTIKELYSLILFSGVTGMSESTSVPYLDDGVFDFRFGGAVNASERFIDAQYATSTIYKGTTMGGNETMFGVNFVDGRIKGYPASKDFEVKLVRGDGTYGQNDFVDNGDGAVTDRATTLMWDQAGSDTGMNWEDALAWVQARNAENYLGYSDWRLPNAKELQSIVDYERSPSFTNSPAISPLFNVPAITDEGGGTNYPFYWTSTTHVDGPSPNKAAYVCFGEALGYMNNQWMDVHGAGAQRSDPKSGDPDNYPTGFGPQGDCIRITNYVRIVRDAGSATGIDHETQMTPSTFSLHQNYPNPFNPATNIRFTLLNSEHVRLAIYNLRGQKVRTLIDLTMDKGNHEVTWDATNDVGDKVASGVYFCRLSVESHHATIPMSFIE